MITPPAISGCSGTSIPLAAMPRWSSQTATTTAVATTNMNAVFQMSRVARISGDQHDSAGDRDRHVAAGAPVVLVGRGRCGGHLRTVT